MLNHAWFLSVLNRNAMGFWKEVNMDSSGQRKLEGLGEAWTGTLKTEQDLKSQVKTRDAIQGAENRAAMARGHNEIEYPSDSKNTSLLEDTVIHQSERKWGP